MLHIKAMLHIHGLGTATLKYWKSGQCTIGEVPVQAAHLPCGGLSVEEVDLSVAGRNGTPKPIYLPCLLLLLSSMGWQEKLEHF